MGKKISSAISKIINIFIVLFMVAGFLVSSPADAKAKELKLVIASYITPGYKDLYPQLQRFVDYVNEHGEGIVQLEFYHSGTLLKPKELLPGLQAGTADIIFHTDSYITGTYPIMGMTQLPLIFKNTADRFEKIKLGMPISNYLYKNLEDKGIHTLGYGVPLMEYIWTVKKPIKKPSDMKGMRLRVSGKIDSKTVAALGASPVRLPSSETYMALKRGIVDGLLSYPGTVAGRKMEDMLHYCTKAPFGCYGVILMTTQKRWESWPENVRKILSEGGKRYETDFYETCKKVNDAYFETKLKDTEVIMLTENEKKEFQKNMGGIYEWWIDLVGKEVGEEALQIIREQ